MNELHLNDPDHNPTSSELLLERSVAKESEPCSTKMEQSSIEENSCEAVRNSDESSVQLITQKKVFPLEGRKWNDIPAYKHFRGNTFEAEVSILVMRLVCRYDQDERETDGAVHWNSMGPKLWKAFQKAGG